MLYGNYKLRSPFPKLRQVTTSADVDFAAPEPSGWGSESVSSCSVCDAQIDRHLYQAWISLRVATDVLPLLVNACSQDCLDALPSPPPDYLPIAHRGGPDLEQPPARL